MDPATFQAFLNGEVDDATFQKCQQWLEESGERFSDFESSLPASPSPTDSLVETLAKSETDEGTAVADPLLDRLQQLIPRHSVDAETLLRWFDPATDKTSLGRIDRYDILEFMAQGGMGLVFRALDTRLERIVCLKLLGPQYEFNAEAKTRFAREAKTASALNHDRIVAIYDVGQQKGLPFLVMPLLEGDSLRTRLQREASLSLPQTINIMLQITDGLRFAHEHGVLHRDLKPDNLWLQKKGGVKILDFGLARSIESTEPLTQSGTVLGTPSYMSPEQITGKPIDVRSDLFSLGVVFLEMLTGESPFRRNNVFSTLLSVTSDSLKLETLDPENQIPPQARQVIEGLLEKRPEDRTADVKTLQLQLQNLQDTQASEKITVNLAGTAGESGGRSPGLIALALLPLFFALAFLLWPWDQRGTLVVSTDDPTVEVTIKQHEVSVFDPQTDRHYQITIGETPLPSGVYQLEMADEKSGLSFSSQTIVIRRGEKTLVSVELKPAERPAENLAEKAKSPEPSSSATDKSESPRSDAELWQQLKTEHDQFVTSLADLPAVDLTAAGFEPNEPIATMASVRKPTTDVFDSWSIEANYDFNPKDVKWNCDRTLGFVLGSQPRTQLVDEDLNTIGAFPISSWSPSLPNLCVSMQKYAGGDEGSHLLVVWRIDEGGRFTPIATTRSEWGYQWLDGHRILAKRNEQLELFNLQTREHTVFPIGRDDSVDSVSPDGRFVALHDDNIHRFNIWDTLRQTHSRIIDAPPAVDQEYLRWSTAKGSENPSVVLIGRLRPNLGSKQVNDYIAQKYSLLDDRNYPTVRLPKISSERSIVTDPQQNRMVWLQGLNQLGFFDLNSAEYTQKDLENDPARPVDSTSGRRSTHINWDTNDEIAITFSQEIIRFKITDGRFNGTLSSEPIEIETTEVDNASLHRANVQWIGFDKRWLSGIDLNTRKPLLFDLQTLSQATAKDPVTPTVSQEQMANWLDLPKQVTNPRSSSFNVTLKRTSALDENTNILFIAFADAIFPIVQGPDRQPGELLDLLPADVLNSGMQCYDLQRLKRIKERSLPGQSNLIEKLEERLSGKSRIIREAFPANDGVFLSYESLEGKRSFGWINIAEKKYDDLDRLNSKNIVRMFLDDDTQTVRYISQDVQSGRCQLTVVSVDQLLDREAGVSYSVAQKVWEQLETEHFFPPRNSDFFMLETKTHISMLPFDKLSEDDALQQAAKVDLQPNERVLWHPSFPSFARSRTKRAIYSINDGAIREQGIYSYDLNPTEFGWIDCPNLIAYDFKGNQLGRATFANHLIDDLPAGGQWILANGAISKDASLDQFSFVYRKGNTFRTMLLKDVVTQFPQFEIPRFDRLPFLKENGSAN